MDKPLVSIMIPNYNYGKYILQAVKSACSQDYSPVEVVVVDNASTDNSIEILEGLKKRYDFRIVKNPDNIGMVRNFHKCGELFKGDYVVFLSSDDLLKPDFISQCMQVFNNYNVGFVATEYTRIDEIGREENFNPFYGHSAVIRGHAQAKIFMMANCLVPSHVLLKREAYNQVGGFSIQFPNLFDWALWFNICLENDIGYIKRSGALYRSHKESATNKMEANATISLERYLLLQDFVGRIKDIPSLNSCTAEAYHKIAENCMRYALRLILNSEVSTARRYLHFAAFCNPDIEKSEEYMLALSSLELPVEQRSTSFESINMISNKFKSARPYPLPEGSIILGV